MPQDEFHTVRGYQLIGRDRPVTSAMEDYLEMICRCTQEDEDIRISQIAEMLHVKAPSVTIMVQRLGELGLVKYERYGKVTMTPRGRELGRSLIRRHETVYRFLEFLCCREDIFVQTELIEHNISTHTLECIHSLLCFFGSHPDITLAFQEFRLECQEGNGRLK